MKWIVFFALILATSGLAAPVAVADSPPPQGVENETCLGCHRNPDLKVNLSSGEVFSVYVDPDIFNASVHGQQGQRCTACHTNITGYPHPPNFASTRREFTVGMYTLCRQCHAENYQKTLDSIHALVLAGGDRNAAVCTDCHGAHDVTPPDQPRTRIPLTCSKCHSGIFNQYEESVHGEALTSGNPDVPTCIDCHGVHNIEDPRTIRFRLKSPEICGKCHGNAALMRKYGISTHVFDTYVADFHGETVELFLKQSPDQPTNKAVCFDCHGIHDIKETNDPESTVIRQNLLATCQQCHPDATANFPAAWTKHYQPSRDRYPGVYYVNLFYRILIPLVIGILVLFILLDIARRTLGRFQRQTTDSGKTA